MERQTAFILWAAELNNKPFVKQESEFSPSYIDFGNKKVSRINIIAVVTQKTQKDNFASITLDDGSAQIRAKTWNDDVKKLEPIKIGDVILLIGKLREYNDELYIVPEIIRQQSYNMFLLRQLSILNESGKPTNVEEPEIEGFETQAYQENYNKPREEKIYSESKRQKILDMISSLDTETGANINHVVSSSGLPEDEAGSIIDELLQEGEIFKISQDRIKIT